MQPLHKKQVPHQNKQITFEFIEAANQLLSHSEYELKINPFLTQWKSEARNFEGKKVINPEFDPDLVELNSSNSFWLQLVRGETIASFAMRDLGTDDIATQISSYDMWGGGPAPMQVENTHLLPTGRVTLEGACWIHPAHRGSGFSWILPRIARALAMQRSWAPDSFLGYIVNRPLAKGKELALEKYGCAELFHFTDSFVYPFIPVQPLYLTLSDQTYVQDQLRASTRCLREYANQEVGRGFVNFIREWQDQPQKTSGATVGSMLDPLQGRIAEIGSGRPIDDHTFAKQRIIEIGR